MKSSDILNIYFRFPILGRILLIGGSIILLFGGIIRFVEPNTFHTFFDGIWWAIVTAATVGYGDIVPKTTAGKVIAILLILLGTGFISAYFVALSTKAIAKENALVKGELPYSRAGHIVIIGWNERAREIINHIPSASYVVVDSTLNEFPLAMKNIHFLRGNPTHDEVLIKANIMEAQLVLITADQHKNEGDADMNSILTLLTIKGLNPKIYAIVEILTTQQANNAKRAGADEIIQTNALSSFMMLNSIYSPGVARAVEELLHQVKGKKLELIDVPEELVGKTFDKGYEKLRGERSLLLGLVRGEESYFNPSPSFTIQKNDRLFILKD